jgi:cell division protein FtsL
MTAQAIPFSERRLGTADGRVRERGPRMLPLFLFVVAVVAVFFSMIFLRISLDETAFELAEIEAGIEVQRSAQLDLRYDLAGLKDPQRITAEAERIGLVYPDERVAITVDNVAPDTAAVDSEVPVRSLVGSDS